MSDLMLSREAHCQEILQDIRTMVLRDDITSADALAGWLHSHTGDEYNETCAMLANYLIRKIALHE